MGGFTKTIAPALQGIGGAMKGFAAFQGIGQAESASIGQAGIQRIQALQAQQAADFSNNEAMMQHEIAGSNVALQMSFAEHLLDAGKTDVAEIDRQSTRNLRMIREGESQELSLARSSAAARGVAMSGSSLQNMENIQTEAERQISDAQYEGSVTATKALMASQLNATSARGAAAQEGMRGIMAEFQAKSNAIAQRANSLVLMDTARYTEEAGKQKATYMKMGSFVSLLGNAGDFASKF